MPDAPVVPNFPVPAQSWPGAGLSGAPGGTPWTQQQIESYRINFIELILQQVVLALKNALAPGPAFDQLKTWAEGVVSDISDGIEEAKQNVFDFLTGIVNSTETDWDNWLLGLLTGESSLDASKLFNLGGMTGSSNIPSIKDWFDGFFGALTGLAGSWTGADATQAATDQAATIAQLSAAVAALQQQYGQNNTNAFLKIVDFSQYGNSTNLPSIFTQSYSASPIYGGSAGTGTYGVTSGRAQVNPASNNPRAAVCRYNVSTCLTDYQIVGGVWTSTPEDDGFGNRGYHYLKARMNSSGTSWVYARFARSSIQLGCVVAGSKTVFTTRGTGGTGSFGFKNNTLYYLLAGTPGGLRSYEVREGAPDGPVVLSYTEIGTTSQVGASFRYGGLGVDWYASVFGSVRPGSLLYWIFGDNTAPSSLGVVFRAYRTSTGTANLVSGSNALPNSWYGATERITSDMSYNSASANALTVKTTGTYVVTVSQSFASGIVAARYFRPQLRLNGTTVVRDGNTTFYPAFASFRVVACTTWQIYLTADDVIRPGIWASEDTTGALTGEAGGTETCWEVALANRSAA